MAAAFNKVPILVSERLSTATVAAAIGVGVGGVRKNLSQYKNECLQNKFQPNHKEARFVPERLNVCLDHLTSFFTYLHLQLQSLGWDWALMNTSSHTLHVLAYTRMTLHAVNLVSFS